MLRKAWIGVSLVVPALLLANAALAGPLNRDRGGLMRQAPRPKIGDMVADFTLQDVKGKAVKLSAFKEKIFVLELGACT